MLVIQQNRIHHHRQLKIILTTHQSIEAVTLAIQYANSDLSRNHSEDAPSIHNYAVNKFRDLNLLLADLLVKSANMRMDYFTSEDQNSGEVRIHIDPSAISEGT